MLDDHGLPNLELEGKIVLPSLAIDNAATLIKSNFYKLEKQAVLTACSYVSPTSAMGKPKGGGENTKKAAGNAKVSSSS